MVQVLAEDLFAGLLDEEEEEEEKQETSKKQSEKVKQEKVKQETKQESLDLGLPVAEEQTNQAKQELVSPVPKPEPPVRQGRVSQPLPVEEEQKPPVPELPKEVEEAVEEVIEEEEPPHKLVITIVGEKGTGKTVTALSFPGEICVMSFDRKAMPVKQFFYKGDKRIHVFDIVKYVDWRPERITETAAKAFDVLEKAFDKCSKIGADWIVIDGTEILEQLAEMYMRHRHGLGPIEGIRNLNIWKERKWILRDVHNKALTSAKRGVIYTVYPTWSERIISGEVVDRRQEPKWLEVILFETDIILWTKYDEANKRFLVEVQSSKLDSLLPTGQVYDVTGRPLGSQLDWKQVFPDIG